MRRFLLLMVVVAMAAGGLTYWMLMAEEGKPAGVFPANADPYQMLMADVYYTSDEQLRELAAWRDDHLTPHFDAGYITTHMTADEKAWLEAQGYQVVINIPLTNEMNQPRNPNPDGSGIPGYACYRTVPETFATLDQLELTYPDLVEKIDIGDSWEKVNFGQFNLGYDIWLLKITNQNTSGDKPVLYISAAIHAREYTPAELATRYAEYLLNNYGIDPDVTWLLDYHEIHIIPQGNPDGRVIAETGLLWRKTVNNTDGCGSSNPPSSYYGVDMNRNFPFGWGLAGSGSNPCGETFRGSSALSEPEPEAIYNHALTIFPDQRPNDLTTPAPITTTGLYLDLHSYGNVSLWSWGFTPDPAPNDDGLRRLGRKMGSFNNYQAAQALSYQTSGTTKDFTYGELGVAGYTIELGTSFFQSCSYFENSIVPVNIPLLVYAAKASRAPYQLPIGPDARLLSLNATAVAPGTPVTLGASIDDTRYYNAGSGGTEPTHKHRSGGVLRRCAAVGSGGDSASAGGG